MQDFVEAIHADDALRAAEIIDQHPEYLDAFVDEQKQFSALYAAAGYGRTNVTRLLLERGAKWDVPCSGGGYPIHVAATHNHVNVLESLGAAGCRVDLPDTSGTTPLVYANGALDATKWLIEHGADVNFNDGAPLTSAINHHHYNVAELLYAHGASASLRQHIAMGHEAQVVKLVSDNPDILDADDEEPPLLELAQANRRDSIVNLLRERGAEYDFYTAAFIGDLARINAEIDADPEVVNRENPRNKKPVLLHAAGAGQDDVVSLLVERGANLSVTDQLGQNLLHAACQSGEGNSSFLSTVKLALSHGIDPNSTFRKGQTALHAATWNRDADVVKLLLERGSDPNQRDDRGNLPLEFCWTPRHNEIREILQDVTS